MEVQTKEHLPLQWAHTQNTLGGALFYLGKMQNDLSILKEAESAYSSARSVYASISAEHNIRSVENNLRIVRAHIQDYLSTTG
jgi:hypothetical protein